MRKEKRERKNCKRYDKYKGQVFTCDCDKDYSEKDKRCRQQI